MGKKAKHKLLTGSVLSKMEGAGEPVLNLGRASNVAPKPVAPQQRREIPPVREEIKPLAQAKAPKPRQERTPVVKAPERTISPELKKVAINVWDERYSEFEDFLRQLSAAAETKIVPANALRALMHLLVRNQKALKAEAAKRSLLRPKTTEKDELYLYDLQLAGIMQLSLGNKLRNPETPKQLELRQVTPKFYKEDYIECEKLRLEIGLEQGVRVQLSTLIRASLELLLQNKNEVLNYIAAMSVQNPEMLGKRPATKNAEAGAEFDLKISGAIVTAITCQH